jgi:hypothetical protein
VLTELEVAAATAVLVAEVAAAAAVTVDEDCAVATDEVVAAAARDEALVAAEVEMVATEAVDDEVAVELLLVSEDVLLSPTHMPEGRLEVRSCISGERHIRSCDN